MKMPTNQQRNQNSISLITITKCQDSTVRPSNRLSDSAYRVQSGRSRTLQKEYFAINAPRTKMTHESKHNTYKYIANSMQSLLYLSFLISWTKLLVAEIILLSWKPNQSLLKFILLWNPFFPTLSVAPLKLWPIFEEFGRSEQLQLNFPSHLWGKNIRINLRGALFTHILPMFSANFKWKGSVWTIGL